MHPSQDIISSSSSELAGKKIVLCLTGSVAVLKTIELARLLMRDGAQVIPVLTESAIKLIGPDLVHWATGNKPVLEITGNIEHVEHAGNVKEKADLILVAPCTANTIGKIASGIDDTCVTTFVTTAVGEKIPVLIVPAMHLPMYDNPIVLENIKKLESIGIKFCFPNLEEGKAKFPEFNKIQASIQSVFNHKKILQNKKILITAGRTVEYIDPVRVITNNSTGKMGIALAGKARDFGAEVCVVYGKGSAIVPENIKVIKTDTADQMKNAVEKELSTSKYDIMIAAAAVGDWMPKTFTREKISTHHNSELNLELVPTPKIIDNVKSISPETFLVAFRALHALEEKELLDNAARRMQKARADMICVNDVSKKDTGFEKDTNEIYIITKNQEITHLPLNTKLNIAESILRRIHTVFLNN